MSEAGINAPGPEQERVGGGADGGRAASSLPSGPESGGPDLPPGVELIELSQARAQATEKWNFLPLTEVNGIRVSLSVIEGEYFSHHHEVDDEFFLVLEGRMLVELESGVVELGPGRGLRVQAGVRHKAIAPEPTVALNVKGFAGGTVKCES